MIHGVCIFDLCELKAAFLYSFNQFFISLRGPLNSFDTFYRHEPKEGQMIVFPSWLMHEVAVTRNEEQARISFSFNWGRAWDQTVSRKDYESADFDLD